VFTATCRFSALQNMDPLPFPALREDQLRNTRNIRKWESSRRPPGHPLSFRVCRVFRGQTLWDGSDSPQTISIPKVSAIQQDMTRA